MIVFIGKKDIFTSHSHKLTIDNPYKVLNEKNPVGSIVESTISSSNDYALYVKIEGYDVDAFLHCNDLSYTKDPETELKNYKIGDKVKVKILEIKEDQQKVRVGLKQTQKDPFDYFNDKKIIKCTSAFVGFFPLAGNHPRQEAATHTLNKKKVVQAPISVPQIGKTR